MKYKMLGRTGLFVSEICLGTMTFGGHGALWPIIGQLDQAAANELAWAVRLHIEHYRKVTRVTELTPIRPPRRDSAVAAGESAPDVYVHT
jgi:hypothetical protein